MMQKSFFFKMMFAVSFFLNKSGYCQFKSTTIRKDSLRIIYLGASGWEVTDGKTIILIDPYFSRLRRNGSDSIYLVNSKPVVDTRRAFKRTDFIYSDTNTVNKYIKKADYILVHHTHSDHVLDVPYIASKTGANVIGNESTANLMYASNLPHSQMITVKGGEDYNFGTFSIRVIPSLHSPLMEKRYFDSRIIPSDVKLPLKLDDYVEGGCLSFLIRFKGYQILTSGSMNFIESELQGIHPDIAIVGAAPSRKEIYNYTQRLMKVLNYPKLVLPTHWDNFSIPLEATDVERFKVVQDFIKEVMRVSPKTKCTIPKYFKAITIPSKE